MVPKIAKLFIFAFFLTNLVEARIILEDVEPKLGDVVEVAIANGNFTTLVQLLTDLKLNYCYQESTQNSGPPALALLLS